MVCTRTSGRHIRHLHGCMSLDHTVSPLSVTLTDTGTWYKLDTSIVDGICYGFTLDASGRLTHNGSNGSHYLFVGSANVLTDKACELNFALYKNGVRLPDVTTPIHISASAKYAEIAVTEGMIINKDDYFEVWVNSDVATTELSVAFFNCVFWGE